MEHGASTLTEKAEYEILVVSSSVICLSNGGFTSRGIILLGLCSYLDKLQSLFARPGGSPQGMCRNV